MVVDAKNASKTTIILTVDVMWTYWVVEYIILVTSAWSVKKTTFWSTTTAVIRHVYHKCIKMEIQLYQVETFLDRKVKEFKTC